MLRLLIKLPTRGRTEQFFSVLARYRALLSGRVPTRFVVSCDVNDPTMNSGPVCARMDKVPNLTYHFGPSRSKVEAINADVPWPPNWDVISSC